MIRALAERVAFPWLSGGRGRLSSAERAEERLALACSWGAGHLLVTGTDRADARDLLERVLRRVDPLGTVRARACEPDPESALDGLLCLEERDRPIPLDRRERRKALLRLLERAHAAGRSVFVVVDDGDDATVAQLERLRSGVEVTPEAIERLRLVFLGGAPLVAKLDDHSARALRSRIVAHVRVGVHGTKRADRLRSPRVTPRERSVAIAAGALFALLAYGVARNAVVPRGDPRGATIAAAPSSGALTLVRSSADSLTRTALRGDEPFLGDTLRISIPARETTGAASLAPSMKRVDPVPVEAALPEPKVAQPAARHATTGAAAVTPPAALNVAVELAAGSSIATLVDRFR